MNRNAKLAVRQWVLAAGLCVAGVFIGVRIAAQPQQVAVKPGAQIYFVDDGPKFCAAGC